MSKIVIARGIAMPFFPMRPMKQRPLRIGADTEEFIEKSLLTDDWLVQPKLEGDRVVLAFVDKQILVQNRHGSWYKHPINNLKAFKKLPDRTVFDGEVFKGNFYPFDCLAADGKSFIFSTAAEREVLALKLCQYVGVEWKFEKPSKKWLRGNSKHLPEYAGVVLKKRNSQYVILGTADQFNAEWVKRTWDVPIRTKRRSSMELVKG
jgi:ATP-dependent DNA ligase